MDTKEMKEIQPAAAEEGQIVLFSSQDGKVRLDVQANGGNVWLRQEQIADLFSKDRTVVGRHIAKILREGELDAESNVQKMHIPFSDKPVAFYSLDVVLAVGYKAESRRAVEFRRWATSILKDYLVKGFSIDSERLKGNGGGQYWYELLNTIKDIRSSEKVLYRQVLDLYATSVDYDASDQETLLFFKMVQNKLHYAIHGQTAAELIFSRADAEKEFMGLTTFRGSHPTKADVTVAKNYLSETELRKLNNMVSGYFDIAENRALDHIPTTMHDYRVLLDNILSAGGSPRLEGS